MTQAARVGDPIEHSAALTGLIAGLAIGAVASALIVGTGGLAAIAFVGAGAAMGAGVGEVLGGLDMFTNDAGQITTGSANVKINGRAAARAHLDTANCQKHSGAPKIIGQGSHTVYINGVPAARVGDRTICDGKIRAGSGNVNIGGETETTDAIDPEVPELLQNTIFAIGLGCALAVAGPLVVGVGIIGALVGERGAGWIGGEIFGEGTDGQKISALMGGIIGGGLAARGGVAFDRSFKLINKGAGSNLGNVGVRPKTPSDKPSTWSKFKYRRGTFRKGVRESVWEKAKTDSPDGIVRDPVTESLMNKAEPWDMGHKPGYEHWKHVKSAEERGLTRKEFLDEFNKPGHYRPELPSSNRSHAGELSSDKYLGP